MKIGVLVKQVPDTEIPIRVRADGAGIEEGQLTWVMNPYDEYAVEEALKIREARGGEVVVCTAGPANAEAALRQALAMGADRALRIETAGMELDALVTAELIASVCREEHFDLLLAGRRATDDDAGCVHIAVAERLDLPHISPVEELAVNDEGSAIIAKRGAGAGRKERVTAPLPALVGCEKGLNAPRYASLPGMMKARAKPIAVRTAEELGVAAQPRVRIVSYEAPPERGGCRRIDGEPQAAAEELVRLLREEAKVL